MVPEVPLRGPDQGGTETGAREQERDDDRAGALWLAHAGRTVARRRGEVWVAENSKQHRVRGGEAAADSRRSCGSALRRERLLQVAPEVVRMLAADAKPEEARR